MDSPRRVLSRRVPLDKGEGFVKGKDILGGARAPLFVLSERAVMEVSLDSRAESLPVEDLRSTKHRYGS